MKKALLFLSLACMCSLAASGEKETAASAPAAGQWEVLFDGKDLSAWDLDACKGVWLVNDKGELYPAKGGPSLFTKKRYCDFELELDFQIEGGKKANSGVFLHVHDPRNMVHTGLEIQILDNAAHNLSWNAGNANGALYELVRPAVDANKPLGQWNHYRIVLNGSRLTVELNGKQIVEADLDRWTTAHVNPDGSRNKFNYAAGQLPREGFLALQNHSTGAVFFKDIRVRALSDRQPQYTGKENIKDVLQKQPASAPESKPSGGGTASDRDAAPHNTPPPGFVALFNGKDLSGWKGLYGNPESRAKMTAEQAAAARNKADEEMRAHWSVQDGVLVFDGKGKSLCTAKEYGDFELYVDWKIGPRGDSGIYLRGSPQVQIWDNRLGSGGLYNNKRNPANPTCVADNPVGQWNRFRIRMIDERVWVWLNGQAVVENVVMENYWNRAKPIFSTGQIELQNHSSPLWFRDIYIREIPRETPGTAPITRPQAT